MYADNSSTAGAQYIVEPVPSRMVWWRTHEDATLRELYPRGGAAAVRERLPHRTLAAIHARAHLIGVRSEVPVAERLGKRERKYLPSPWMDDEIRAAYAGDRLHKGAVTALAEKHHVPTWWVKKRAVLLGCARLSAKDPPWTDAELELLERHAHKAPDVIRRIFARAGYHRSAAAIVVRRKREECDTRDPDHMTATALARLLGMDNSGPARWCRTGLLKATRRGTARTEQQGGDQWWIHRADLRRFFLDHPERIVLGKITDVARFLEVVSGETRR